MKYHTLREDQRAGWSEWVVPTKRIRDQCCDCGLIHEIEYRIVGGQVEFRARRHKRATAAARRKRK